MNTSKPDHHPIMTARAWVMLVLFIIALVLLYTIRPSNYYYIEYELISPEFISPPPPPASEEWQAELDYIIQEQSTVSQAEIDEAEKEVNISTAIFYNLLGGDITPHNYPKTNRLLEKSMYDCNSIVFQAKYFYTTKRPHMADERVKSRIGASYSGSYPSGHTACIRVWAEVLGQLMPEKRAQLRAKAKQSARYRVIGGQHWPHDVKGGEDMALMIFGALQTSPKYQAELKAAQAEWK